jgi:hypothetical protein
VTGEAVRCLATLVSPTEAESAPMHRCSGSGDDLRSFMSLSRGISRPSSISFIYRARTDRLP